MLSSDASAGPSLTIEEARNIAQTLHTKYRHEDDLENDIARYMPQKISPIYNGETFDLTALKFLKNLMPVMHNVLKESLEDIEIAEENLSTIWGKGISMRPSFKDADIGFDQTNSKILHIENQRSIIMTDRAKAVIAEKVIKAHHSHMRFHHNLNRGENATDQLQGDHPEPESGAHLPEIHFGMQ